MLHTDRGNWHFSVLYSNTALAHQLGRTRDWVVVYFYDNHHPIARHVVLKRKFSVPRPSAAASCSRALEGKICPNQDRQIDLA